MMTWAGVLKNGTAMGDSLDVKAWEKDVLLRDNIPYIGFRGSLGGSGKLRNESINE
jgi:hypothetical protein